MKDIIIKGAREHNLKNISLELPRDKLIVITGLSGSGKSTLAFDTLYAEGQRRYVESLSAYARQFLGLMNKPDVDSIEGLSPAISIEQRTTSKNPRSTVGTVTEIYDYLRLLFARIGVPYCPEHNLRIESQSPDRIAERIRKDFSASSSTSGPTSHSGSTGTVTILAPVVRQLKGTYEKQVEDLAKEGYTKVRIDGKFQRTDEKAELERYKKHDIEAVIDKLDTKNTSRLKEAVENGLKRGDGLIIALDEGGKEKKEILYSSKMACPKCGLTFEELEPRMFSFNSPFGACETCNGLGIKMEFDPELIVPDKSLSIADGAIKIYRNAIDGWRGQYLGSVAKHFGFSAMTPIKDLTKKQYEILMYGSDEKLKLHIVSNNGDSDWSHSGTWEGILPQCERLYRQTESEYRRTEFEKYMRVSECPSCKGRRLKDKILAVKIGSKSIIDFTDLTIGDALVFITALSLTEKEQSIAKQIFKEIKSRLTFLNDVGLSYLTLSRAAGTLSGGEAQRIRLATQIGSNLMGVLYILDEPSIGLHQKDNRKLIDTLVRLRDIGNTLIVVEHDEDTIRAADYVVDMGPGAGIHGGHVVAEGTPKEIEKNPDSLTGKYLSGNLKIEAPVERRKPGKFIHFRGCSENNLKNIDVHIPIGLLTLVTGVSGSGKSTLVYEIIYKSLMQRLYNSRDKPGKHGSIEYEGDIDKVIIIDQSPIGRTPRSNPSTYTKVFDEVRKIFASTKDAKMRGYKEGRFSFNVKGGRCEACQGDGIIKIEMNFLPEVYVPCEECHGKRYNSETLEVKYKDKSIADVLDLSVEEALELFANVPSIRNKLQTLTDVGLTYIKLGQSSTTLSGGEAQRIKLTRELSKRGTGRTLYLLDEPTTGLHFHDVKKLIEVLQRLVDNGNTVVVIEHNLDVIKSADHIIDLGPEGGDRGGEIVAAGTPEELCKNKKSYTGQFLNRIICEEKTGKLEPAPNKKSIKALAQNQNKKR